MGDTPYTAHEVDGAVVIKYHGQATTYPQNSDEARAIARDLLAAADKADGKTWDPRNHWAWPLEDGSGCGTRMELVTWHEVSPYCKALLDEYLAARAPDTTTDTGWPTIGGQTIG